MSAVVLRGDAGSLPLPDESVDLIVTSPPYWKLRDYRDGGKSLEGQIGNEATPEEYIANLLRCTAEWARVLKPSGSMFVVLGDKYSQPGKGERNMQGVGGGIRHKVGARQANVSAVGISYGAYPAKSLLFLPERYRIGCVTELGLIARAKIIWSKPNHMPESVDDRVAVAHEDIVHLVKSSRYFAAVDEIREPHQPQSLARAKRNRFAPDMSQTGVGSPNTLDPADACNPLGKLPGTVWEIPTAPLIVPEHVAHSRCCGGRKREGCTEELDHYAAYPPEIVRRAILGWCPAAICVKCETGRFPVTGVMHERGWVRKTAGGRHRSGDGNPGERIGQVVNNRRLVSIIGYACACTPYTDHPGSGRATARLAHSPSPNGAHPQGTYGHKKAGEYERVGPWREYHLEDWTPPPTRPAVVADPFGGSGTTALVADVLDRIGVSVDLSGDYCTDIATWRIHDPAERARALGVPKPPPVPEGQEALFDLTG